MFEDELINKHAARAEVLKTFYGGIGGLWRKMTEHGVSDLSRKAVEKWFERDKVPNARFFYILKIIEIEQEEQRFLNHLQEYGYVKQDII